MILNESKFRTNKVVLHILNDVRKSGAERMLYSATQMRSEIGLCSIIVGFGNQHTFATDLERLGIKVVSMEGNAKSIGALMRYIRYILKAKVDILHIHIEQAFLLIIIISKIIRPNIKIVRTVHGDHRQSGFLKFRRRIMGRVAIFLFKVEWIACSSYISRIESELLGTEVSYIENWASLEFCRTPALAEISKVFPNQNSSLPKLLIIGNCDSNKNHLEILQNQKIMQKYHIIHVGSTDSASEEEIEVLAGSNVSNLQIEADVAYQICDLVILPSIREAMSVVVIECLIRGKEIMVTREWGSWWANQFESVESEIIEGYWLLKVQEDLESIRERFSPLLGIKKYSEIYYD